MIHDPILLGNDPLFKGQIRRLPVEGEPTYFKGPFKGPQIGLSLHGGRYKNLGW